MTLLLLAFIGLNAAVLAARRDRVDHLHFVVQAAIPVIGALVCVGLLTQRESLSRRRPRPATRGRRARARGGCR